MASLGELNFDIKARGLDSTLKKLERLERQFEKLGRSQTSFGRSSQKAGQTVARSAQSTDKARRSLRQLDSTLGGARRASAQLERAQERLNTAWKAGLLTQSQFNARQREMAQRFSTAEVKSRDLRSNFQRLNKTVGGLRVAFLGVVAAIGALQIGRFVQESIAAADRIDKVSQTANVGTAALQQLRFAFSQSGIEARRVDDSFRRFNRRLGEAQRGSKEFGDAFRAIGVNIQQDTTRALEQTLVQLAGIENDSKRAALAARAFGEDVGPALAGALDDGIGAINELRQQAQDLGLVLSDELIDKAVRVNDRMNALAAVIRTRVTVAIVENADRIDRLVQYLADRLPRALEGAIRLFQGLADNIQLVTTVLGAFLGLKFGVVFGKWGALIGALAGAFAGSLVPSLARASESMETQIAKSKELRAELDKGVQQSESTAKAKLKEAVAREQNVQATIRELQAEAARNRSVTQGMQRPGMNVAPRALARAKELEAQLQRSRDNVARLRKQIETGQVTPDPSTPGGSFLPSSGAGTDTTDSSVRQIGTPAQERTLRAYERVEAMAKENAKAVEAARQAEARRTEQLRQMGEALRKSVLTPTEQYRDRLEELNMLVSRGAISQETYARAAAQATEQLEGQASVADQMEQAVKQLGATFTSSFEAAIIEGKGLREVLQGLLKDISQILLRATVTAPLNNFLTGAIGSVIGGLGGGTVTAANATFMDAAAAGGVSAVQGSFAKGGAFQGGRNLKRFASGGVVNRPTVFPMARGAGLMGESGPEAVLPLSRTGSGDLGVRLATGSGGGGGTVVFNNSIDINVEGGTSDQRGNQDQARRISDEVRRVLEAQQKKFLQNQTRAGNILNPISGQRVT